MIRLIHLTDTHLLGATTKRLNGFDPLLALKKFINFIQNNESSAHAIMLTGDLSENGDAHSYQNLISAFSNFDKPVYWTIGNHDNEEIAVHNITQPPFLNLRQFQIKNWNFIMLNSVVSNKNHGNLSKQELMFLSTALENSLNQPTVIMLHHHAIKINSKIMDNVWLENAESFWNIVKKYPQVKLILSGHVHQVFEQQVGSVYYTTSPSTCYQLLPGSQKLAFDTIPPGYRWVNLHPNGIFETGVIRLEINAQI